MDFNKKTKRLGKHLVTSGDTPLKPLSLLEKRVTTLSGDKMVTKTIKTTLKQLINNTFNPLSPLKNLSGDKTHLSGDKMVKKHPLFTAK